MGKIVEKIRENELHSIVFDECTDVSIKEQMSLLVRFVADVQIHEAFLGFFELDEALQEEQLLLSLKLH